MSWSSLDLAHATLELVDDEKYEVFRFNQDGFVAATLGTRNGPLTAPLLHWRIKGDHLIISFQPHSGVYADLHTPRRDGNLLTVQRNPSGESRYRITQSGV